MTLLQYDSVREFEAAIRPFLESHEAANSLFLGRLTALRDYASTTQLLMGQVCFDDNSVFGAFFTGSGLILSEGPTEAIPFIVSAISESGLCIPSVVGPLLETELFAQSWCMANHCTVISTREDQIYELKSLKPPRTCEGFIRRAVTGDVERLTRWTADHASEALGIECVQERKLRNQIVQKLNESRMFVWDRDGVAVSMASILRPTRHTMAINAVYTPLMHRNFGYATALVAGVSEHILNSGKQSVVLYTDRSNMTANSIYQKLGFIPICRSLSCNFSIQITT